MTADPFRVYIDALRSLEAVLTDPADQRTVARLITEARQHRRTVRAAARAADEAAQHRTDVTAAVQAAQAAATAADWHDHDADLTALLPS